MKQRYFFQCAYDGTDYSGWQIQPNALTIQEEIENRLSQLYSNKKVSIMGCGRTDAGVHAEQAFFHADLEDKYSIDELKFKLNNMLPPAIAIHEIYKVDKDTHARFDATKRTYNYYLHHKKLPFYSSRSWYHPVKLDLEKMNKGAKYLLGRQDFTSFSKLHTDVNNNFCEVFSAKWEKDGDLLKFSITANRFLRDMVRAIVGTLVEVGKGNIPPEEVERIIKALDRGEAGHSVPPQGLFLAKVDYPFLEEI